MATTEPGNGTTGQDAYVTLLTRPSYLAGAILLAYSLYKHSPKTPLIIAYTPETFPDSCAQVLKAEAKYSNVIVYPVEHLRLPDDGSGTEHGMVAERFIDTWTKLRVFDLHNMPQRFRRMCWLDADMMIFSDPSPLIFNNENDTYMNGDKDHHLMAVHTCVCNLDHDSWAPSSWVPENCALTHLKTPSAIPAVKSEPETFALFNSGAFLFCPSASLSTFIHSRFEEMGTAHLRAMKFPDQDFLNEVFQNNWKSLSWKTNALKTWRYWHTNIWRDEDVAVLHYIVDKPWVARLKEDGTAGYLGKDGETHSWWWREFEEWRNEREGQGEKELLAIVEKYAASKDGLENEELSAIGGGAQDFAKKWKGKEGEENEDGKQKEDGEGQDEETDGETFRKRGLGERGHGPVLRGSGIRGRKRGGGWCVTDA